MIINIKYCSSIKQSYVSYYILQKCTSIVLEMKLDVEILNGLVEVPST